MLADNNRRIIQRRKSFSIPLHVPQFNGYKHEH